MSKYKQPGEVIDVTASGADITVDSVVVVGNQLAVAAVDIADGSTGSGYAAGVFELPKKTGAGEAITQGSAPVWDVSASVFAKEGTTPASGDVSGAVTAWAAAGDSDATVLVKLNTGIGTVTP